MNNKRNFSDILEQSDDQTFQTIIDRQEAALAGAEEPHAGQAPSREALAKWEEALDKLPPKERRSRRGIRRAVVLAAIIAAMLLAVAAGAFHQELLN